MKYPKLTLAVATLLSASASSAAFAIDLYVDSKTKQIYAEPGRGREKMGSFVRVEDAAKQPEAKPESPEIQAIREDLELKTTAIAALEEHAKEAEEYKIKLDDGIEFKSKDGNFKAAINGRIQTDAQINPINEPGPVDPSIVSLPNQLNDGVNVRRARLGVEGTFFKDYDYKFEYDFSRGNGSVAAGITDAFVRLNFSKPFSVKVGSFKEPFSLEEATSNRFLTFIERNMAVNSFIDNPNTYKTGIGANYSEERWQVAAALQTEPVGGWASSTSVNSNGSNNRNNGAGDTGWEVTGRVSGMPWMESKTQFWHIGGSGSYTNVNTAYNNDGSLSSGTSLGDSAGQGVAFGATTDGNVDRTNILNTGGLSRGVKGAPGSRQIDSFNRYGAETAVVYGPFSAQAEYIQTDVFGAGYSSGGDSLRGYYGYMSYFLTGESRTYKAKTGAWDRIKPNHNFDLKSGWGAWEVAAGYDYLNLNSGVIRGGEADTVKFGLNWYPISHVRVMGNFIHVLNINTLDNNAGGAGQARSRSFNNANLDMLEFRTQVDF